MKPRLLFCTNRPPLPAWDGTRERILGELQTIGHDYQIDLLVIGTEKFSEENRQKLMTICGGEIKLVYLSKFSCLLRTLLGLFSRRPLQVSYFYDRKIGRGLLANILEYQAIYFHTLRFGEYAKQIKQSHP